MANYVTSGPGFSVRVSKFIKSCYLDSPMDAGHKGGLKTAQKYAKKTAKPHRNTPKKPQTASD